MMCAVSLKGFAFTMFLRSCTTLAAGSPGAAGRLHFRDVCSSGSAQYAATDRAGRWPGSAGEGHVCIIAVGHAAGHLTAATACSVPVRHL